MKAPTLTMRPLDDDVVLLNGGMDQITAALTVASGVPRYALNYECTTTGSPRRIDGYERFDGRTAPSAVSYRIVPIPIFSATVSTGQLLVGSTSLTSATVIAVGATYVAVTQITAPGYLIGEVLTVGGVIVGSVGPQTITLTKRQQKQYLNLAADVYRALIGRVPNNRANPLIGPIRGVFGATFNGVFSVYAFRDYDVGGTAGEECKLFKATTSGWSLLALGQEVKFFNGGTVEPAEGTIFAYLADFPGSTQFVTIKRVVLQSGSWIAGTAAGFLIVTSTPDPNAQLFHPLYGPFTSGSTSFTTTLPSGRIAFSPGGKFEFDFGNFGGRLESSRIYGCDGVNRCFEFDGEVLTPIGTGIEVPAYNTGTPRFVTSLDSPSHIRVHHDHLIVAIGSSILNSGIGTPFTWTAGAGAAEHATGDRVTGLLPLAGAQGSESLAVTMRNHTKVLYGTAAAGPTPFQLVNLETQTGALPYTIQKLDKAYYLDDRGVTDLQAVQTYGNFAIATVTRLVQKFIDSKRGRAIASTVHRGKNQYRLFFNDGTGLYVTMGGTKVKGVMPVAFPHTIFCAWSGEDNSGQEVTLLGSNDGMVYQLDRGTSFDGESIAADLLLPWNLMKTPRRRKTIHKASIEIQDADYVELQVGARLGPALTAHVTDDEREVQSPTELNMRWNHFTWGDFWWGQHADMPIEVDVKGTAERIQYVLRSNSDYLPAHTLTSIITHYFLRRGLR